MNGNSREIIFPALAAIFLILYSLWCTTPGTPGDYRHTTRFEGISISSEKSDQKIANDTTWQLFFTLKKPEKCIKIVFSSLMKVETLKQPIQSEINTYFVVEKIVDISRYKAEKKSIFYEIGRNFDIRWNSSPLAVLCTDETDPLKKLDQGLYRIRFSGLKSTNFHYRVEIFSALEEVVFGF